GHAAPFQHGGDRSRPAERILAEAPRRQDMGGQEIRLAGNGRAAFVSDQRDVVATPFQLLRQSESGRQMPAGAASGQDEMPRNSAGHGACSFSNAERRSNFSRSRYGLRR